MDRTINEAIQLPKKIISSNVQLGSLSPPAYLITVSLTKVWLILEGLKSRHSILLLFIPCIDWVAELFSLGQWMESDISTTLFAVADLNNSVVVWLIWALVFRNSLRLLSLPTCPYFGRFVSDYLPHNFIQVHSLSSWIASETVVLSRVEF